MQGGFATSDEMCLSFIIYYPKMGLDLCESVPMYNNVPRAQSNGHAVASQFNFTLESDRNKFKMLTSTTKHWAGCNGASLTPQVICTAWLTLYMHSSQGDIINID